MIYNEDTLKAELERLFQNGGPKVYLVTNGTPRASSISAKRTLALAYAHEKVYARRKVRGEQGYEWTLVGVGK